MTKIPKAGRYVFAFCTMAFGVQQLLFHEFLPVFMPLWPAWIHGHIFWTFFFSLFLMVIGMAIILNLKARLAALVLGIVSLLLLVFVHLPFQIANNTHSLLGWADAFTILALAGSAFIIAGTRRGTPGLVSDGSSRVGYAFPLCWSHLALSTFYIPVS